MSDREIRKWSALCVATVLVFSRAAMGMSSGDKGSNGAAIKAVEKESISTPLVQYGYGGLSSNVAYSPDGTKFLAGSDDQKVRLFDADTGALIRTFTGHADRVNCLVFSADGTKLLSGSSDHTAKLWDATSGRVIRTFDGHANSLVSVALSPEGTNVFTAEVDSVAKMWDTATGAELHVFAGHTGWINCLTISPDGSKVLTGASDNTAKLWDTATGACIRTFTGHTARVISVAFSADGTKVLTGSYDATANLWDAVTGACIHTFDGYPSFSSVNAVAFSPDGSAVLTGRSNNTAQMWNAVTGAELHTFAGDTQYFRSAIFSPDGTRVLTGAGDNAVNVWDAATGTEIRSFAGHMGGPVSVAAFSPDGTKVLTGAGIYDSAARLWDTATGTLIHILKGHTQGVRSVTFSPDGTQAATAGGDDAARLWDTAGGTCLRLFSSGRSENCAAFSPDGTKVLTGSGDSKARLWDAVSGELVRTFEGHTAQVSHAAFFHDGTRIITAASGEPGYTDCSIKVWDAASGAVLRTLGGGLPVSSLSFFPNGTKIILGFPYGSGPLLTDASTYEITNFLPGHTHQATSAVLSPDGTKALFREVWPDKVLLWNVATGTELRNFVGHTNGVGSVSFSPDGTKVLTAGLDSTARLWPVVGGIVDVIVPDVMGQTEAAAATALAGANLTVGEVAQHCSDTVMPGMVISQNPAAGQPAPPGNAVNLTVSTGPCDGHVVFTNPPQSLRRFPGETAQFSVTTLGGIGALHYQWWFDNGQKTRTAVGSDAPTLTLSGLTLANSGTYSCDVTDQVPATYSSPTVVLEVRERIGMPVLGAAGITALAVLMALGGTSMARRRRR